MAFDALPAALVQQLKLTRPGDPHFALFLGAGASVSSGIRSGGSLVAEWQKSLSESFGLNLLEQPWHKSTREYGELFKLNYPTPASRRDFIESIVSDASPSWGYLYLAELLARSIFGIVLTTNFDDLVQEACYSFTRDVRPLVCAHDAQTTFRLHSRRPKLIKLHGDFLSDELKNTPTETSLLGQNIENQLREVAKNYGLVVVGYGGSDVSVMSVICDCLLRRRDFAHGVYWCTVGDQQLPNRLQDLGDVPNLFHVRISGFDDLMSEIYDAVSNGVPPRSIADPLKAASDRFSHLLKLDNDPTLSATTLLSKRLKADVSSLTAFAQSPTKPSIPVPPDLAAWALFQAGDYASAISYYLEVIRGRTTVGSLILFFECLRYHWNEEAFNTVKDFLDRTAPQPGTPTGWLTSAVLSLIHAGKYDEAQSMCELAATTSSKEGAESRDKEFVRLNELQILLHRGIALTDVQSDEVRAIAAKYPAPICRFGCHILLQEHVEAMELVKSNKGDFNADVCDWPIIQLLSKPMQIELLNLLGSDGHHYGRLKLEFGFTIRHSDLRRE